MKIRVCNQCGATNFIYLKYPEKTIADGAWALSGEFCGCPGTIDTTKYREHDVHDGVLVVMGEKTWMEN